MKRKGDGVAAFLFLLPLLFTLTIAFLYAFVRTVYFSFTDYNLFKITEFVGLRNYLSLFKEQFFVLGLIHSLVYAGIVTASQTFLALLLAIVANQKIRGLTFFRAAYYVPSIASSVAITTIFIWLVNRRGTVNWLLELLVQYWPLIVAALGITALAQALQVVWERRHGLPVRALDPVLLGISFLVGSVAAVILGRTGLIQPNSGVEVAIPWLTTRKTFLGIPLPLLSIMMLNIWTTTPTMMILFLAGLQDIPRELYEVADIDGASPWQKLRFVTVPALRPVMFLVITLGLIGTIQMFDQAAITAGIAPLESVITLAYYVYWAVFGAGTLPKVGMASAAALVLAALTLAVVLLQRKLGFSEKGWYS
ncbi:sugar ABC transporter permease [Candidatus Bipolaricaulota bacterium]|nr:sugar ABC transporter permease [Candidatus Bipolaricaulota bacterium]